MLESPSRLAPKRSCQRTAPLQRTLETSGNEAGRQVPRCHFGPNGKSKAIAHRKVDLVKHPPNAPTPPSTQAEPAELVVPSSVKQAIQGHTELIKTKYYLEPETSEFRRVLDELAKQ